MVVVPKLLRSDFRVSGKIRGKKLLGQQMPPSQLYRIVKIIASIMKLIICLE